MQNMDRPLELLVINLFPFFLVFLVHISLRPQATQTKFIVSQARPHDKIAFRLLFLYHVMTHDHRFS